MLCRVDFSILEACALLGYYAAYTGNSLRPFQNNSSVLPPRIKNPWRIGFLDPWRWEQ